ncbi:hypothetical protein C8R43DRAFT_920776 [Mycena crocata]|nr:hypothetical protein C8R43DRAFT_920776 [Mycena crocata]
MITEATFPVELEREIFETAAWRDHREIPTLLRVARRVLIWLEPILYQTIHIDYITSYTERAAAFLRTIQSKPAVFFQNNVRHILLDSSAWSVDEGKEILKVCTGVVNLVLLGLFSEPTMLPILANMHIQRLGSWLRDLFEDVMSIDVHHPLFNSVTHLDIFDVQIDFSLEVLSGLPSLTHLSFSGTFPWGEVRALLEKSAGLQLLLNVWAYVLSRDAQAYARSMAIDDVRFVMGLCWEYWSVWAAGTRGLGDFWSQGDDFVARKRRGEIDGSCYWLEGTVLTDFPPPPDEATSG